MMCAATFDAPRRILILLIFQLLKLLIWLHEDCILKPVPISFQATGLDRPFFHFRRLPSFGHHRRPIPLWQKHGYVCYLLPSFDLAICKDVERNPGPLAHRSTSRRTFSPPCAISPANQSNQAHIVTKFHTQTNLLRLRSVGRSHMDQTSLRLLKYRKAKQARKRAVYNILPITFSRRDCRSLNIQLVTSDGVNSSVLKPLRSLQSSPPKNPCFAICIARSIGNKVETIIDHAVGNDIGLCIFTETWLKDLDSLCIADLSSHGYLLKRFPRQSN